MKRLRLTLLWAWCPTALAACLAVAINHDTADAAAITGAGLGATNGAAPSASVAPLYVLISNGQSLSIGADQPGKTLTPPFPGRDLWLADDAGTFTFFGDASTLSLVNLTAFNRIPSISDASDLTPSCKTAFNYTCYPTNLAPSSGDYGESTIITTADELTYLTGGDAGWQIDAVNVGVGASSLSQVSEGGQTNAFEAALSDLNYVCELVAPRPCIVIGAVLIDGETDSTNLVSTADFTTGLLDYQATLQRNVQLITGQTKSVRVYLWQTQSSPSYTDSGASTTGQSTVAQAQAEIQTSYPDLFTLIGPEYYSPSQKDGVHKLEYRIMGEKGGEAIATELNGNTWSPLQRSIETCTGSTLTISLNVPFPPLVFDSTQQPNHAFQKQFGADGGLFPNANGWTGCQGFGGWVGGVGGTPVSCVSATIVGSTVVVVFASPIDTWEYGVTPDGIPYCDIPGSVGQSCFGGRSGNLRDSDPFTGYTGLTIGVDASVTTGQSHNWMVTGYWPVTCH